jgi:hypothetical protein
MAAVTKATAQRFCAMKNEFTISELDFHENEQFVTVLLQCKALRRIAPAASVECEPGAS